MNGSACWTGQIEPPPREEVLYDQEERLGHAGQDSRVDLEVAHARVVVVELADESGVTEGSNGPVGVELPVTIFSFC